MLLHPTLYRPHSVLSPIGNSELFLRNFNVWVRSKGGPKSTIILSTDGAEGNCYTL